jgi:hypothetical protein
LIEVRTINEFNVFFFSKVNEFVRTLRGPTAEGRFADQVHHFKAFSKPWRFSLELHDQVYGRAEGLLNLWRRQRRGEVLPFTDEEAIMSSFLMYWSTQLDDYLVTQEKISISPSPYTFFGEDDIPCSLAGIITTPERYQEILSGQPSTPKKRVLRRRNQQQNPKGKEKQANTFEFTDEEEDPKHKRFKRDGKK